MKVSDYLTTIKRQKIDILYHHYDSDHINELNNAELCEVYDDGIQVQISYDEAFAPDFSKPDKTKTTCTRFIIMYNAIRSITSYTKEVIHE